MSKKKQGFLNIKMISSAGTSFGNWLKILIEHRFKVGLKYIPRALAVTFVSFFSTPFIWLEKLLFNGRIKRTEVKSPVFIVGHMRSGTTFLHYLLSKDEQFTYASTTEAIFPYTFLTLSRVLNLLMRAILPKKRPMDNMSLQENFPQEEEFAVANLCPYSPYNGAYFPADLEKCYYKYSFFQGVSEKVIGKWKKAYTYFLKKLVLKSGGRRILSKSLVNSGRLDKLIEMFPDAKFVFIYRDPYKVFLSTKKLYQKFIFEHMSFNDLADEELERVIVKLAKSGFEKYFADRKLLNEDNLVEVKFEDFVSDPVNRLESIYKQLDLGDFSAVKPKVEELAKQYENYKPDSYNIDQELLTKLKRELKSFYDEYKYSVS